MTFPFFPFGTFLIVFNQSKKGALKPVGVMRPQPSLVPSATSDRFAHANILCVTVRAFRWGAAGGLQTAGQQLL